MYDAYDDDDAGDLDGKSGNRMVVNICTHLGLVKVVATGDETRTSLATYTGTKHWLMRMTVTETISPFIMNKSMHWWMKEWMIHKHTDDQLCPTPTMTCEWKRCWWRVERCKVEVVDEEVIVVVVVVVVVVIVVVAVEAVGTWRCQLTKWWSSMLVVNSCCYRIACVDYSLSSFKL